MKSIDIQFIQDIISHVFAMPEREQAAEWQSVISQMDANIASNPFPQEITARDIFIEVAKEAKHFA